MVIESATNAIKNPNSYGSRRRIRYRESGLAVEYPSCIRLTLLPHLQLLFRSIITQMA